MASVGGYLVNRTACNHLVTLAGPGTYTLVSTLASGEWGYITGIGQSGGTTGSFVVVNANNGGVNQAAASFPLIIGPGDSLVYNQTASLGTIVSYGVIFSNT